MHLDMSKRWTLSAGKPKQAEPKSLSWYFERYPKPTFAQRRRIRKAALAEYDRAMSFTGAVRSSAMRKLAKFPLDGILAPDLVSIIRDPKWTVKKSTAK